MVTRRHVIQSLGAAAAAIALGPTLGAQTPAPTPQLFTLPPLGYAPDALEPFIDAQTMQIHHDKHHAAYVSNLNAALADQPDFAKQSLETILSDLSKLPESIRVKVRNNGGGHANHTLFWASLRKNENGKPVGDLAAAIEKDLGGFDNLKKNLTAAATGVFGSGWAWLVVKSGKLEISSLPNQDSPLSNGQTPILGIDVWEHAYYLKYQNRRADYLAAFFNVIDWDALNERYKVAPK